MIVKEKESQKLPSLLEGQKILEQRQVQLKDGEMLVRILLDAEQTDAVLDLLHEQFPLQEGNHLVILPVQAILPREEKKELKEKKKPERIGRDELFEDIQGAARCSYTYLAMTLLATIVAAIGLGYNSVAIIIGAMVIAPLLGPNVAVAFGTTLGDLRFLWRALFTNLVGIALALVASVIIGTMMHVTPSFAEFAFNSRTRSGNIVVALASGSAGTIAFTTGVSAVMIGVMVAVALLPPLVTFGLFLGGGYPQLSVGALSLFLTNLVCVNLAGVVTFWAEGIHPVNWWEKARAKKATLTALGLWLFLLAALICLVVFWG